MVVLGLEAEVALDVDLDLGQGAVEVLPYLVDVFLEEEKLPVRLCASAWLQGLLKKMHQSSHLCIPGARRAR